MATNRFYARSALLLVDNEANLSKPERSLWHFDQLYAGGVALRVTQRSVDGTSTNCFDLPKVLPGHLSLLSAEVFEPLKLNLLVATEGGRARAVSYTHLTLPTIYSV